MSRASAPGKLVLVGEYAVLRGHPALVTAVSRRVRLEATDTPSPTLPAEVLATLARARAAGLDVPDHVRLDVTALQHDGTKLGLGSSAAAAAAAARLALGADAPAAEVAALADAGHRAVAPSGSGIDVAASVYGGTLRCIRHASGLEVAPLTVPVQLVPRVVFSGGAARTSELVARVEALEAYAPAHAAARLEAIAEASRSFESALAAGDVPAALSAIEAHAAAMDALGRAADAPIVEARLARIGALARAAGGAAKPSGAGGGDVAIAFFADPESASHFDTTCAAAGFLVVPLAVGDAGARLD